MAAKVVDASALAAVLFGEPEGPAMAESIQGDVLYAPSLIRFEIASICVTKLRRHPDQREALLAALAMLNDIEMDIVDVDVQQVVNMAEQSRLTAYDASYLWLARTLDAGLVTLDAELAAAMGPRD